MKIKDIIKASATLLGKENVLSYLGDASSANKETLSEVNVFTNLANLLLVELACSYIPMQKTEDVNGQLEIAFNDLSEKVVKVIDVLGCFGKSINYLVKTDRIVCSENPISVVYQYLPSNYALTDDIAYTEKDVSVSVLSYGLCAEFCITEARYEEAIFFHEKYILGLEKLKKQKIAKWWQEYGSKKS